MLLILVLLFSSAESSYYPFYIDDCCPEPPKPPPTQQGCLPRFYKDGMVCVCSGTYCDTISKPQKPNPGQFLVYTSNLAGLRFSKSVKKFQPLHECDSHVEIIHRKQYQTIFGFGGAFTDSTGININSLPEETQQKLLESYFSQNGIEYNIGRVPMGGTDFSVRAYSYDDGVSDPELLNFKLAPEDYRFKIPNIRRAINLTNNQIKLFTSTWTAPKWMKTNDNYTGIGLIKKIYYQTWADYFIRFFDEYQKSGIDFWGVTTGNEPFTSLIPDEAIESVSWPSWAMGKWIRDNLGPTIRTSRYSILKIMILDDNRAFIPWYVVLALKDPNARKYIDGIAIHWYLDRYFTPLLLSRTQQLFSEKFLFYSEATNTGGVVLGSWDRGELYSANIIEDMLHWVVAWVDWNMVLNLEGGPTYIRNFCDSPIIVNATSGEFYKQPMFYHLGHFAKFISRGSVRIQTEVIKCKIEVIAFQRPDHGTTVVLLNRRNESVAVNVKDRTRGIAELQLTPRSINTILYW